MSDLSPELRALVLAGRNANLPSRVDSERILAALQARLGPSIASQVVGTGSAVRTMVGKIIAIAAASMALATVGIVTMTSRRPEEVANSVLAVPRFNASAVVPAVATNVLPINAMNPETTPARPAGADPSGSNQTKPSPGIAASRVAGRARDNLSEEVAILSRAETELHAGRVDAALRLLNDHERRFRDGILAEERIAARIQALCALGRVSAAKGQMARLSPESLHSERARRACGVVSRHVANQPAGL